MNTPYSLTLIALATAFASLSANAEPTIMLEKSQSYVLGKQVQAFQVPTEDAVGNIKYYDLIINLTLNPDGTVSPIADVSSQESPVIKTRALVPGKYKATDGTTCDITNLTLTNGRIQSLVNCSNSSYGKSELSFASGNVTADHPNYTELAAAGIDKRTDVKTQTWGIVTNGKFAVGSCHYYENKYPLGIKTDGKTLLFSVYGKSKPSAFQCSGIFNKL